MEKKLTKEEKDVLDHLPLWFKKLREIHLKRHGIDLYKELDDKPISSDS